MLISLTKFRILHQQFHFSLVKSLISVRQSYISLHWCPVKNPRFFASLRMTAIYNMYRGS